MKYITMATEIRIRKMVKQHMEYANELQYILDELKCREHCMGATVTEMRNWDIRIDNANEVALLISAELRGLGANFENQISVVDCCNIHCVSFSDFNKLVRNVQAAYTA